MGLENGTDDFWLRGYLQVRLARDALETTGIHPEAVETLNFNLEKLETRNYPPLPPKEHQGDLDFFLAGKSIEGYESAILTSLTKIASGEVRGEPSREAAKWLLEIIQDVEPE